MSKRQAPEIQSAITFPMTDFIPSQPLQVHPNGLAMTEVWFPNHPWQTKAPPHAEDYLNIHLEHGVDLRGKIERPFHVFSKPGDMYIIPRGEAAEWEHQGGGHILILFLAPPLLANVALEALDLDPARVYLTERVGTPDLLVQAIGQALLNERQSQRLGGLLYTESLTHTLLMHLLRHYVAVPQTPPVCKGGLAAPTLRRVLDYINSHLANDLSLTAIAKVAHLSAYHFTRLFKQSMGESLHQYVIRQRVEVAQHLLLHESLTVAEVAAQVGFADQSHLGRHCKQLLGMTPKTLVEQGKNLPNQRKRLQDPIT